VASPHGRHTTMPQASGDPSACAKDASARRSAQVPDPPRCRYDGAFSSTSSAPGAQRQCEQHGGQRPCSGEGRPYGVSGHVADSAGPPSCPQQPGRRTPDWHITRERLESMAPCRRRVPGTHIRAHHRRFASWPCCS
jgi:hypothetical protein